MFTFKAVKRELPEGSGLLKKGLHAVEIATASFKLVNNNSEVFADQTPQIEVQYKGDGGVINQWFNLKGYMNIDDLADGEGIPEGYEIRSTGKGRAENYIVSIANNTRLENPDKTAKGVEIFQNFLFDIGVSDMDTDSLYKLVGIQMGVMVDEKDGKVHVKFPCSTERLAELKAKASAVA